MSHQTLRITEKGRKLYFSNYEHADHVAVGNALRSCGRSNWMVTYDDVPAIRAIYKSCRVLPFYIELYRSVSVATLASS